MNLIWGIITLIFSLFCWGGQAISLFWPIAAAKMGLTELEADVDPAYFADLRAEALWDTVSTWVLVVAAILMIINNAVWPYFGLIGGGIYLYFAGRGIAARMLYQRRGISIGKASSVKQAYVALSLWGMVAVGMIVLSILELS
ncbi:MAG: hypothetical protein HN929_12005 [Chloroflexi bacterium]|jgi:hypothetical protein|nr:hypothetical protein [Chloroflexota bacterium]MBT7082163.1 hypothetical protein [Chloroflexota bacterium]MBT7290047.1 hypothetical protein [Chloroflexota bacterium]